MHRVINNRQQLILLTSFSPLALYKYFSRVHDAAARTSYAIEDDVYFTAFLVPQTFLHKCFLLTFRLESEKFIANW